MSATPPALSPGTAGRPTPAAASISVAHPATEPLIHIGYHKTGTSWLQDNLFASAASGYYAVGGRQPAIAIEQFVTVNPFRFDARRACTAFHDELLTAADRRLAPVISHEGLSGNPIEARYDSREIADRLHATFPDARVLIGVREQRSMLLSAYGQYIRRDGTRSLAYFIGTGTEPPGFAPLFRLDYLEFDLLIAYYQSLFREVLALPLELLQRDPADYARRIAEFAHAPRTFEPSGRPTNVGWGGVTLHVRRRLNALCPRDKLGARQSLGYRVSRATCAAIDAATPRGAHRMVEQKWERRIDRRVGDRYRESNRRTSALIGIDLGELGYPT